MSQDQDSGDKTEQPTPKKLQDARKKGQVPKSKDLTSTVDAGRGRFALALLASGYVGQPAGGLMDAALRVAHEPFVQAAPHWRHQALLRRCSSSAPWCCCRWPRSACSPSSCRPARCSRSRRCKPKLEHMNPVEGVKRMFTMDALVELLKAVRQERDAAAASAGWW